MFCRFPRYVTFQNLIVDLLELAPLAIYPDTITQRIAIERAQILANSALKYLTIIVNGQTETIDEHKSAIVSYVNNLSQLAVPKITSPRVDSEIILKSIQEALKIILEAIARINLPANISMSPPKLRK